MSVNKTTATNQCVERFLTTITSQQKRIDSAKLVQIFTKITGKQAVMWGTSIIGFGLYHYKYKSGREGDMLITGFSPRKQNLALYIMQGFENYNDLLSKLGKYKTGKSCLYINKLADIDVNVLKELISITFKHMQTKYKLE